MDDIVFSKPLHEPDEGRTCWFWFWFWFWLWTFCSWLRCFLQALKIRACVQAPAVPIPTGSSGYLTLRTTAFTVACFDSLAFRTIAPENHASVASHTRAFVHVAFSFEGVCAHPASFLANASFNHLLLGFRKLAPIHTLNACSTFALKAIHNNFFDLLPFEL